MLAVVWFYIFNLLVDSDDYYTQAEAHFAQML